MDDIRRIRPPGQYEAEMDALIRDAGGNTTKQSLMVLAAALGRYREAATEPSGYGVGIRWDVFQNSGTDAFVEALAIDVVGSLEALSSDRRDDVAEIVEAHAAGGMEIIKNEILDQAGDILDNFLELIQSGRGGHAGAKREEDDLTVYLSDI